MPLVPLPPPGYVTLANVFTVIGHFSNIVTPTEQWRVTQDIISSSGIPTPSSPIIAAIEAWFAANISSQAMLNKIEMRNWARGNVPFSTQGHIFETIVSRTGEKAMSNAYGSESTFPLGKEVVASFVKAVAGAHKPGKQFMRGVLDEVDAHAQSGTKWSIKTGAVVNDTAAQAILTARGIAPFFSADPGFVVVHWSRLTAPLAPFSEPQTGLHYVGPSTNKPTHKNPK